MSRNYGLATALVAMVVVWAHQARAQNVYFPGNTTINYAVNGDAIVGYGNDSDFNAKTNGTSPLVNIVSGGSISNSLNIYNAATVNMTGGSMPFSVFALNASTFDMSAGNEGDFILAQDHSTIDITGGTISSYTGGNASSNVTIAGGTFGTSIVPKGATPLNFVDNTTSSFTFLGQNLVATDIGADAFSGGEDYLLTGLLRNGQSASGDVVNVQSGAVRFSIINVPEPACAAVLWGCAAALVRRPGRSRGRDRGK